MKQTDHINPDHYKNHPSGLECIEITEFLGFNLGNAWKYQWRGDNKPDQPLARDMRKTRWYLERDIDFRKRFGDQSLDFFLPPGTVEKMHLATEKEPRMVSREVFDCITLAVTSWPDTS